VLCFAFLVSMGHCCFGVNVFVYLFLLSAAAFSLFYGPHMKCGPYFEQETKMINHDRELLKFILSPFNPVALAEHEYGTS
jgi:hypothetical protein